MMKDGYLFNMASDKQTQRTTDQNSCKDKSLFSN
jgi:hypothetical protein